MKTKPNKILAIVLSFATAFSLAACKNTAQDDKATDTIGTTAAQSAETGVINESTTQAESVSAVTTTGTSEKVNTEVNTTATVSAANTALPVTAAQILAAYTAVMNKAKADKPAYHRIYFQTLPEDKRKISRGGVGLLLKLAGLFMTSEEKARKNPEINEKNSAMKMFPIANSDKGCLLTNVNAIKSAKCAKLANGNYKITLVLKDELNSEPYKSGKTAPSNVGAVFIPISKSVIDDTLNNDSRVSWAVKNPDYSLKYYDSTSVLEYNPGTKQAVSLEQYLHTIITVSSAEFLKSNVSGSALLHYTVICDNFEY